MGSITRALRPARRHGPAIRPLIRQSSQPDVASRLPGQALVELSLVLLVCMTILVGLVDLGRAFSMAIAVQGGAGAAAHLGAEQFVILTPSITTQAILQRLVDSSKPFLDGCTDVSANPTTCTSGGGTWTLKVIYVGGVPTRGGSIEVQAVGQVPPLALLTNLAAKVGLGQITVQGDAKSIVL